MPMSITSPNILSPRVWEVQTVSNGRWVNAIISYGADHREEIQFPTREAAEAEMSELSSDIAYNNGLCQFRVQDVLPNPLFEVGDSFRSFLPLLKAETDMVLSYRYHNGSVWRYHLGLILGPVGFPVDPRYQHCRLAEMDGVYYVDYCTVDEEEALQLYQKAATRYPRRTWVLAGPLQFGQQFYWNAPTSQWADLEHATRYHKYEIDKMLKPIGTVGQVEYWRIKP